MSTELTREQACEAYLAEREQAGAADKPITIGRAFRAGWSARDAEVERLRAAVEAAKAHVLELEEAWRTGALSERDGKGGCRSNRNVDVRVQLQAALAHKEPSDA